MNWISKESHVRCPCASGVSTFNVSICIPTSTPCAASLPNTHGAELVAFCSPTHCVGTSTSRGAVRYAINLWGSEDRNIRSFSQKSQVPVKQLFKRRDSPSSAAVRCICSVGFPEHDFLGNPGISGKLFDRNLENLERFLEVLGLPYDFPAVLEPEQNGLAAVFLPGLSLTARQRMWPKS